jgi:hypothetical protein
MTEEQIKAYLKKLSEYVTEMAQQHNALEKRVEALGGIVGSTAPLALGKLEGRVAELEKVAKDLIDALLVKKS